MTSVLYSHFLFRHPCTVLISGPTGSGKTRFVQKVLVSQLIQPPPQRIVWVYGEWQRAYAELQLSHKIEFIHDVIPPLESFSASERNLLVLDDQMDKVRDSVIVEKYFTQGSHHRNITVFALNQNAFAKGKSMRTISLNSRVSVLFKNPRDISQVRALGVLMFAKDPNFLVKAYEDATKDSPYGYLIIDAQRDTPDQFRVISNIFPDETQVVYLTNKDGGQ